MVSMDTNPVIKAVNLCGRMELARALGVTYQAIQRWEKLGRLPRTEWTSETHYSQAIEQLTGGQVTAAELLQAFSSPAAVTAHSAPQP